MPRRNIHLIVGLSIVCLMCAVRTSRHGRVLTFAINQIGHRYLEEIDNRELVEGALEGMMDRLDEYSSYISPDVLAQFQEDLDKEFGGIGVEIVLDPDTKQLTVASPLVGTPAYEAGILAGDKVLRIDGESTQGLSLQDAADRMRGKPGDPLTLTILHPGDEEPVDVELVRAIIHIDTVLGDTRDDQGKWDFFLEGRDRIGYVRINSFSEQTDDELKRALEWLDDRDVQGVVLDLRNDLGGMLGAAVRVCDLFVDSGVIVTTRRRDGQIRQAFHATQNGTYSGFPVAVLVNNYTASASEIVAACLQDHDRAVVVGERTFGKGTVQELIELEADQGMLKLTTASYWRPSGKNIHRHSDADEDDDWGVTPNPGFEVGLEEAELAKLLSARFRRDINRQNRPPEERPAYIDLDPQLAKAVEHIEQRLAGREGEASQP